MAKATLVFVRQPSSYSHLKTSTTLTRQARGHVNDHIGRGGYNPLPAGNCLRVRNEPEIVAAAAEVYLAYSEYNGIVSTRFVADNLYPAEWDAGQTPLDHPLLDEQKARRWEILRGGAYVAEIGFRIHALLVEHNAGLWKPPQRSRGQVQNTVDEVQRTMSSANMRIHVERGLRLAREYHRFNRTIPIHSLDLENDEVFLEFMLCNFRHP